MKLSLLIVDDDPDDAQLIAYRLKRAGYAVTWTRVEDEAGFTRRLPDADLVICDFSMPKFSPVRALDVIRRSGLATPLLLVSGSVSADTANQLMRLGAVGYVSKNDLERVGQAVSDILAGRTMTPTVTRSGPIVRIK